jgi:nitrite reductase/ring-hydroxylating ferredoxin subunit
VGELIKVAETQDLPPGTAIAVEVQGCNVALFNIGDTYYAIDDTCTHQGGPLSEGTVEGKVVTCPWHGATYDVTTGKVLGPPAPEGVTRYNVQVDGEDVKIEVS